MYIEAAMLCNTRKFFLMKYFFTVFVVLIFSCSLNVDAQSLLQIKTFEGHKPLPFATVFNHSKNLVRFSDENGTCLMNLENGDSITISFVGYEKLSEVFHSDHGLNFLLKQKTEQLSPVLVNSCNKWKVDKISSLDPDPHDQGPEFGGLTWGSAVDARVAVMLKPAFENSALSKVSLWIKHAPGAPKMAIHTPMILSFYSVTDSTQLPGDLISSRQVIYSPRKEGRQTIDIDSLHIRIPGEGMYLAIQYIIEDKYQWPIRYIDSAKCIDTVEMAHGAWFQGAYSNDFILAYYNYKYDKWAFGGQRDKSTINQRHGTIKFEAEIKYCIQHLKN